MLTDLYSLVWCWWTSDCVDISVQSVVWCWWTSDCVDRSVQVVVVLVDV